MVKELLENAIDAQSSRIDIDIDRGGSSLIRISDDGTGIDKADLSLAVSRHATSKLSTLTELEKINSLGFRGEALASISAVSRLAIFSRPDDQQSGWMIDTGTDSDFANYQAQAQPTAHPIGTTVEVRDLFFNTPARRKFMRTVKTEFRHIDEVVKRIALSRYDIAFKLTHNKKIVRNLPKAMTDKAIAQRIGKLFSSEFLSHSHKVDVTSNQFSHMGPLRLWGWVSDPTWHRKHPDWQYFYVNNRFIRDKLVNHALRQVFQELLPTDTYAAYLLYLEIEPDQVDVNVHPTKHEVRFRQTRLVHDFIYSALKQATNAELHLADTNEVDGTFNTVTGLPEAGHNSLAPDNYVNQYGLRSHGQAKSAYRQVYNQPMIKAKDIAEQLDGLQKLYGTESKDIGGQPSSVHLGRSLGYVTANYLLSQMSSDDGQVRVYIIHVSRTQQFLLHRLFQPGQLNSLLIPETVSLPQIDIERLLACQTELAEWGLDLSQLAEQTLLVRAIPGMMNIPGCACNIDELIQQILVLLQDLGERPIAEIHMELRIALVKSIFSEPLTVTEQQQLLTMLANNIDSVKPELTGWDGQVLCKAMDESVLNQLFGQQG